MFDYTARPDLLQGRVILVTGAGRGIGAAAAKAFAALGATVLLLGKTEANLNEVYDQIEAAGHPQPVVIPFNLETALPHQYDELAVMIEDQFGRLDGLLNNASIIGPRTPLEQLSGDNFMRVMHINVDATFMLTSTLLPLLKLSQDASVVFTSSSVGRKGRAYWGAYGVSKFATEGLMQTLADEPGRRGAGALQQHQPGRHAHGDARPGLPQREPAEQPAARRDHAGVPVPDGAGQHRGEWAGVQRSVRLEIAGVALRPQGLSPLPTPGAGGLAGALPAACTVPGTGTCSRNSCKSPCAARCAAPASGSRPPGYR